MKRESVTVDGIERNYLVQQGEVTAVIVVLLHGTGSTAEWCAKETGLPHFAEAHRWTLLIPEGRPVSPEKAPKFLTNPTRWNDGSTHAGEMLHTDVDDVSFLRVLLGHVCDGRRVFVVGFSNGAGMAFRFASECAELVAGVMPISGNRWTATKPTQPVPTLFMLGEADPLFPIMGGVVKSPWGGVLRERPNAKLMFAKWAHDNGCVPARENTDARDVRMSAYSGTVFMQAMWLPHHGHHWPGGGGQLCPSLGGRSTRVVSANEELRKFVDVVTTSS